MFRNLRQAEQETGKICKVNGCGRPRRRNGPMEPGPAVVKHIKNATPLDESTNLRESG